MTDTGLAACGHGRDCGCGAPFDPPPRILTVAVSLSIDLDLDDYRLNYGSDDVATIRNDVRGAVLNGVTSGGILADGIVGARLKGSSS